MVFLYTREAHPGEHYPHHTSPEEKLARARLFAERFGVRRPVLVDDLEGTLHRAYGLLPNMIYIVGRRGRVLYRSAWTHPRSIAWALDYLLAGEREGGPRREPVPFYAEILGHRGVDRAAFLQGLREAGPKAVEEYIGAAERNRGRGAAEALRRLLASGGGV